MELADDQLVRFESEGAEALPTDGSEGYVECDGARVWFATYGSGPPVILLHGGLGHGENWGYQVPALVQAGYQALVIDSRGHGRSTRDSRPYSYAQMAEDVFAVMDHTKLARALFVGWSDGACIALVMAKADPERVAGVLFFACNVDADGTKESEFGPIVGRCLKRHSMDYKRLSPVPDKFGELMEDLGPMQKEQPNYSADDLRSISVPVLVVYSENDEFIRREHAAYVAGAIPSAKLVELPGVSHFAPLQRPGLFNDTMLTFAADVLH